MSADAAPPAAATPAAAPAAAWPLWKRIGFRFLAAYFLLYTLPYPIDMVPWLGGPLNRGVNWLWQRAGLWVGPRVFGIEGEIFLGPTGSGDTTFDYLRLFLTFVLAAVATLAWSLADHRRRAYPRAARWLVVGCRFYLGLALLSYGLAKVIPTQFTTPGLTRLLQTYGASSPMGIVWTFMGLSPAYTVFSGVMETIPGLLLFFRRTRLLGALLATGVMANVAIINYAFDVPVKLFSSHLLAMAVALVLLDARRLAAFFLGDRPAPPAEHRPLFESGMLNLAAAAVGALIVGSSLVLGVVRQLDVYGTLGAGAPRPAIWGIHDVESFRADGEELPPLLTDEARWRALVIDRVLPVKFGTFERPGRLAVQRMDGEIVHHPVELDEEAGTLTLLPEDQMSVAAAGTAGVPITDVLRYERPEPGRMVVRGTFQGRQIEVTLSERDLEEMLLISRGYHWINERPLNK